MNTLATDKQVSYALSLLGRGGWSTRFMSAEHRGLGATSRQCVGTVESWLRGMDRSQISALIDQVK